MSLQVLAGAARPAAVAQQRMPGLRQEQARAAKALAARQHLASARVAAWNDTRPRRMGRKAVKVYAQNQEQVMSEEEAWRKRAEEAKEAGTSEAVAPGEWRWTLNWDYIEDNIIVGSCPRSVEDMDRLVEEVGIEACMCLQSDACFEAMNIDWDAIRVRAIERGVVMSRIAVRDFDHNDQANMLPEAVRVLAGHLQAGRKTYVHCTAGINRATLTVVGYLVFCKGLSLEAAVPYVRQRRPQAHPYVDCFKTSYNRMLEGRGEELGWMAGAIYEERKANGTGGNSDSDWKEAEMRLARETFRRRFQIDDITETSLRGVASIREKRLEEELKECRAELMAAMAALEPTQTLLHETMAELEARNQAAAEAAAKPPLPETSSRRDQSTERRLLNEAVAELERQRLASSEATSYAELLSQQVVRLKDSIASKERAEQTRAEAAEALASESQAQLRALQAEVAGIRQQLAEARGSAAASPNNGAMEDELDQLATPTVVAAAEPLVEEKINKARQTWRAMPFAVPNDGEAESDADDPLFAFCVDNPDLKDEIEECQIFWSAMGEKEEAKSEAEEAEATNGTH